MQNIYLRSASFKMVSRNSPEVSLPSRIMLKLIAHTTTQSPRYIYTCRDSPQKTPFYFNPFIDATAGNYQIWKAAHRNDDADAAAADPLETHARIALSGRAGGANTNSDAMDFEYLLINNALHLIHLQSESPDLSQ